MWASRIENAYFTVTNPLQVNRADRLLRCKIPGIELIGDLARVDYTYRSQFLLLAGEQDRWSSHADKNRITFQRVPENSKIQLADGTRVRWTILAGM